MTTTEAEVVEAEAPTEVPEAGIAATSLVYLDPAALAANPANVRSELGDLTVFLGNRKAWRVILAGQLGFLCDRPSDAHEP